LTSTFNFKKGEDEKAWDTFYTSHQTKFFKDRHYFRHEFGDEFRVSENSPSRKRTLVEVGCGVGNALLPLLDDNDCEWTVHGLDLSKVAIDLMRHDERFRLAAKDNRAQGYVCDISAPPDPNSQSELTIPESIRGVADVTTLLFCLSAIAPGERMAHAVTNVASTLIPNKGVLVFRDYGRYDEAQMKLGTSRSKQLDDENFYRKHDGTKCYYFTLDDIRDLFERQAGLKTLELDYIRRVYRNRAKNEVRRRVWVQGRFQKV
jgi:methyltransferase-like protein 6